MLVSELFSLAGDCIAGSQSLLYQEGSPSHFGNGDSASLVLQRDEPPLLATIVLSTHSWSLVTPTEQDHYENESFTAEQTTLTEVVGRATATAALVIAGGKAECSSSAMAALMAALGAEAAGSADATAGLTAELGAEAMGFSFAVADLLQESPEVSFEEEGVTIAMVLEAASEFAGLAAGALPWLALRTYSPGDLCVNGNDIYECVEGGRSSGVLAGPTGEGSFILDGSVRCTFLGPGGVVAREIARAIADATESTNAERWGDLADRAIVLLAAHQLSVNHPGARPGEKEKEGTTPRYLAERQRLLGQLGLTPTVT